MVGKPLTPYLNKLNAHDLINTWYLAVLKHTDYSSTRFMQASLGRLVGQADFPACLGVTCLMGKARVDQGKLPCDTIRQTCTNCPGQAKIEPLDKLEFKMQIKFHNTGKFHARLAYWHIASDWSINNRSDVILLVSWLVHEPNHEIIPYREVLNPSCFPYLSVVITVSVSHFYCQILHNIAICISISLISHYFGNLASNLVSSCPSHPFSPGLPRTCPPPHHYQVSTK